LPPAVIRYALCTGCDEVIILTDPPPPPVTTRCGACLLEIELDATEIRTLDQIADEVEVEAADAAPGTPTPATDADGDLAGEYDDDGEDDAEDEDDVGDEGDGPDPA
jgi:hypothetical protein